MFPTRQQGCERTHPAFAVLNAFSFFQLFSITRAHMGILTSLPAPVRWILIAVVVIILLSIMIGNFGIIVPIIIVAGLLLLLQAMTSSGELGM
jgi:hypothetical protein